MISPGDQSGNNFFASISNKKDKSVKNIVVSSKTEIASDKKSRIIRAIFQREKGNLTKPSINIKKIDQGKISYSLGSELEEKELSDEEVDKLKIDDNLEISIRDLRDKKDESGGGIKEVKKAKSFSEHFERILEENWGPIFATLPILGIGVIISLCWAAILTLRDSMLPEDEEDPAARQILNSVSPKGIHGLAAAYDLALDVTTPKNREPSDKLKLLLKPMEEGRAACHTIANCVAGNETVSNTAKTLSSDLTTKFKAAQEKHKDQIAAYKKAKAQEKEHIAPAPLEHLLIVPTGYYNDAGNFCRVELSFFLNENGELCLQKQTDDPNAREKATPQQVYYTFESMAARSENLESFFSNVILFNKPPDKPTMFSKDEEEIMGKLRRLLAIQNPDQQEIQPSSKPHERFDQVIAAHGGVLHVEGAAEIDRLKSLQQKLKESVSQKIQEAGTAMAPKVFEGVALLSIEDSNVALASHDIKPVVTEPETPPLTEAEVKNAALNAVGALFQPVATKLSETFQGIGEEGFVSHKFSELSQTVHGATQAMLSALTPVKSSWAAAINSYFPVAPQEKEKKSDIQQHHVVVEHPNAEPPAVPEASLKQPIVQQQHAEEPKQTLSEFLVEQTKPIEVSGNVPKVQEKDIKQQAQEKTFTELVVDTVKATRSALAPATSTAANSISGAITSLSTLGTSLTGSARSLLQKAGNLSQAFSESLHQKRLEGLEFSLTSYVRVLEKYYKELQPNEQEKLKAFKWKLDALVKNVENLKTNRKQDLRVAILLEVQELNRAFHEAEAKAMGKVLFKKFDQTLHHLYNSIEVLCKETPPTPATVPVKTQEQKDTKAAASTVIADAPKGQAGEAVSITIEPAKPLPAEGAKVEVPESDLKVVSGVPQVAVVKPATPLVAPMPGSERDEKAAAVAKPVEIALQPAKAVSQRGPLGLFMSSTTSLASVSEMDQLQITMDVVKYQIETLLKGLDKLSPAHKLAALQLIKQQIKKLEKEVNAAFGDQEAFSQLIKENDWFRNLWRKFETVRTSLRAFEDEELLKEASQTQRVLNAAANTRLNISLEAETPVVAPTKTPSAKVALTKQVDAKAKEPISVHSRKFQIEALRQASLAGEKGDPAEIKAATAAFISLTKDVEALAEQGDWKQAIALGSEIMSALPVPTKDATKYEDKFLYYLGPKGFWDHLPLDSIDSCGKALSALTQCMWEAKLHLNEGHLWANERLDIFTGQAILTKLANCKAEALKKKHKLLDKLLDKWSVKDPIEREKIFKSWMIAVSIHPDSPVTQEFREWLTERNLLTLLSQNKLLEKNAQQFFGPQELSAASFAKFCKDNDIPAADGREMLFNLNATGDMGGYSGDGVQILQAMSADRHLVVNDPSLNKRFNQLNDYFSAERYKKSVRLDVYQDKYREKGEEYLRALCEFDLAYGEENSENSDLIKMNVDAATSPERLALLEGSQKEKITNTYKKKYDQLYRSIDRLTGDAPTDLPNTIIDLRRHTLMMQSLLYPESTLFAAFPKKTAADESFHAIKKQANKLSQARQRDFSAKMAELEALEKEAQSKTPTPEKLASIALLKENIAKITEELESQRSYSDLYHNEVDTRLNKMGRLNFAIGTYHEDDQLQVKIVPRDKNKDPDARMGLDYRPYANINSEAPNVVDTENSRKAIGSTPKELTTTAIQDISKNAMTSADEQQHEITGVTDSWLADYNSPGEKRNFASSNLRAQRFPYNLRTEAHAFAEAISNTERSPTERSPVDQYFLSTLNVHAEANTDEFFPKTMIGGKALISFSNTSPLEPIDMMCQRPDLLENEANQRVFEMAIFKPLVFQAFMEKHPDFFVHRMDKFNQVISEALERGHYQTAAYMMYVGSRIRNFAKASLENLPPTEKERDVKEAGTKELRTAYQALSKFPSYDTEFVANKKKFKGYDVLVSQYRDPKKNQKFFATFLLDWFRTQCPEKDREMYLKLAVGDAYATVKNSGYEAALPFLQHELLNWFEYQLLPTLSVETQKAIQAKGEAAVAGLLPKEITKSKEFLNLFGTLEIQANCKRIDSSTFEYQFKLPDGKEFKIRYREGDVRISQNLSKAMVGDGKPGWYTYRKVEDTGLTHAEKLIQTKGVWISEDRAHGIVMLKPPADCLPSDVLKISLNRNMMITSAKTLPDSSGTVYEVCHDSEGSLSGCLACVDPGSLLILRKKGLFESASPSEIRLLSQGITLKKQGEDWLVTEGSSKGSKWVLDFSSKAVARGQIQNTSREFARTLGVEMSECMLVLSDGKEDRILIFPSLVKPAGEGDTARLKFNKSELDPSEAPLLEVTVKENGQPAGSCTAYLYMAYLLQAKKDYKQALYFLKLAVESGRLAPAEQALFEKLAKQLTIQTPSQTLTQVAFNLKAELAIAKIREQRMSQEPLQQQSSESLHKYHMHMVELYQKYQDGIADAQRKGTLEPEFELSTDELRECQAIQTRAVQETIQTLMSLKAAPQERQVTAPKGLGVDFANLQIPPEFPAHLVASMADPKEKAPPFSEITHLSKDNVLKFFMRYVVEILSGKIKFPKDFKAILGASNRETDAELSKSVETARYLLVLLAQHRIPAFMGLEYLKGIMNKGRETLKEEQQLLNQMKSKIGTKEYDFLKDGTKKGFLSILVKDKEPISETEKALREKHSELVNLKKHFLEERISAKKAELSGSKEYDSKAATEKLSSLLKENDAKLRKHGIVVQNQSLEEILNDIENVERSHTEEWRNFENYKRTLDLIVKYRPNTSEEQLNKGLSVEELSKIIDAACDTALEKVEKRDKDPKKVKLAEFEGPYSLLNNILTLDIDVNAIHLLDADAKSHGALLSKEAESTGKLREDALRNALEHAYAEIYKKKEQIRIAPRFMLNFAGSLDEFSSGLAKADAQLKEKLKVLSPEGRIALPGTAHQVLPEVVVAQKEAENDLAALRQLLEANDERLSVDERISIRDAMNTMEATTKNPEDFQKFMQAQRSLKELINLLKEKFRVNLDETRHMASLERSIQNLESEFVKSAQADLKAQPETQQKIQEIENSYGKIHLEVVAKNSESVKGSILKGFKSAATDAGAQKKAMAENAGKIGTVLKPKAGDTPIETAENSELNNALDSAKTQIAEQTERAMSIPRSEIPALEKSLAEREGQLKKDMRISRQQILKWARGNTAPPAINKLSKDIELYGEAAVIDAVIDLYQNGKLKRGLQEDPVVCNEVTKFLLNATELQQIQAAKNRLPGLGKITSQIDYDTEANEIFKLLSAGCDQTRYLENDGVMKSQFMNRKFLVTEYRGNVILRKEQIKIISDIICNPNLLALLRMGLGKTSFIMPLIVQILAELGMLVFALVTEELLKMHRTSMDEATRSFFRQAGVEFDFQIDYLKYDESFFAEKYYRNLKAKKDKSFVITTIESKIKLENALTFIADKLEKLGQESEKLQKAGKLDELNALQKEMRSLAKKQNWLIRTRDLFKSDHKLGFKTQLYGDEGDEIADVRRDVNQSLGQRRPNTEIVDSAQDVMSLIMGQTAEKEKDAKEHPDIVTLRNALLSNTHASMLPSQREKSIRALAEDVARRYFPREQFNFTEDQLATYLTSPPPTSKEADSKVNTEIQAAIEKIKEQNPRLYNKLSSLKKFLSSTLPSKLTQNLDIDMGVRKSDGCVVVPLINKTERQDTRFSDEHDLVLSHALYYLTKSPSDTFLKDILRRLPNTDYLDIVNKAQAAKMEPLEYLKSPGAWNDRLMILNRYVISERIQLSKEQISFNVHSAIRGCNCGMASGTMNPASLPDSFTVDESRNARVVEAETFLRVTEGGLPVTTVPDDEVIKKMGETLGQDRDGKIKSIINAGVAIKSWNTLQIVSELRKTCDKQFIFVHPEKRKAYMWEPGASEPVPFDKDRVDPKKCLFYFDPADTRGTDFQIPPGENILLSGPTTTMSAYAQSAWRERRLGSIQKIRPWILKSVADRICAEQQLKDASQIEHPHIFNDIKKRSLEERGMLNFRAVMEKVQGFAFTGMRDIIFENRTERNKESFWDTSTLEGQRRVQADIVATNALFRVSRSLMIKPKEPNFEADLTPSSQIPVLGKGGRLDQAYTAEIERLKKIKADIVTEESKLPAEFRPLCEKRFEKAKKEIDALINKLEVAQKETIESDKLRKVLPVTVASTSSGQENGSEQVQEQQQQQVQQQQVSVTNKSGMSMMGAKTDELRLTPEFEYLYQSKIDRDANIQTAGQAFKIPQLEGTGVYITSNMSSFLNHGLSRYNGDPFVRLMVIKPKDPKIPPSVCLIGKTDLHKDLLANDRRFNNNKEADIAVYSFDGTAKDKDGDNLMFVAENNPGVNLIGDKEILSKCALARLCMGYGNLTPSERKLLHDMFNAKDFDFVKFKARIVERSPDLEKVLDAVKASPK